MRFGTGQLPVWRPIQPVNCKILIEIQEHPIKTRIPVAQQQFPFIINSTAGTSERVILYSSYTYLSLLRVTSASAVYASIRSSYRTLFHVYIDAYLRPVVHLCHSAEWSIRIFDILETHIHDLFMANRNFQSSMLMRMEFESPIPYLKEIVYPGGVQLFIHT